MTPAVGPPDSPDRPPAPWRLAEADAVTTDLGSVSALAVQIRHYVRADLVSFGVSSDTIGYVEDTINRVVSDFRRAQSSGVSTRFFSFADPAELVEDDEEEDEDL